MIGGRGLPATYGGVERHIEEIGARLVERGHEVTVYCRPHYTVRDSGSSYRGMRLVVLPGIASKHLDALSHTAVAAAHAAKQGFDIVHYHAVGPGLISPLSRATGRGAVVLTVHGLDFGREKWGLGARLALQASARLSAYVPDRTIVVAEGLREHYRDSYGVETSYVPNGVTLPANDPDEGLRDLTELGVKPDDYLLSVGRLVPEKGHHLLVDAFGALPADARPQLVIVGGDSFTGGYVRELTEQAQALPDVHLPGFLYGDALQAAYANARLFVQSSTLEGMPLTVLEAAAYSRPLVLSDIPVHRQLLGSDRPGGRLFTSGDSASLSAALERALRDPEAEAAGGRQVGAELLDRFSWEKTVDGTLDAYAQAMEARGATRAPDRPRLGARRRARRAGRPGAELH
ncbi:Glycosyltransferase involved in cell wall bisynthesis [Modestobacter sp. DSM 44400]|nr:Glycosyltransferase involved in cell wall bisynthesis [Modestobacter sp. DSM 44400]